MNTNLSTRNSQLLEVRSKALRLTLENINLCRSIHFGCCLFLPFYMMIINATHSNGNCTGQSITGKQDMGKLSTMSKRVNIWRGF